MSGDESRPDPFAFHMNVLSQGLITYLQNNHNRSHQDTSQPYEARMASRRASRRQLQSHPYSTRSQGPAPMISSPEELTEFIRQRTRELIATHGSLPVVSALSFFLIDDPWFRSSLSNQQHPANNVNELLTIYAYTPTEADDGQDTCGVCLEKHNNNKPQVRFSCEHRFHRDCAGRWMKVSATCPYCRRSLEIQ